MYTAPNHGRSHRPAGFFEKVKLLPGSVEINRPVGASAPTASLSRARSYDIDGLRAEITSSLLQAHAPQEAGEARIGSDADPRGHPAYGCGFEEQEVLIAILETALDGGESLVPVVQARIKPGNWKRRYITYPRPAPARDPFRICVLRFRDSSASNVDNLTPRIGILRRVRPEDAISY